MAVAGDGEPVRYLAWLRVIDDQQNATKSLQ